jgi:hypothetical protein
MLPSRQARQLAPANLRYMNGIDELHFNQARTRHRPYSMVPELELRQARGHATTLCMLAFGSWPSYSSLLVDDSVVRCLFWKCYLA